MDSQRLRERARVWRKRAERESGDDRVRSLKLARSYEALARTQDGPPPSEPEAPLG